MQLPLVPLDMEVEMRTHRTLSRLSFLFPMLWFETVCFAIVVKGMYLGIYILKEERSFHISIQPGLG